MRCVIVKLRLSTEGEKIGLTNVEFQSHTFETTKWIALYIKIGEHDAGYCSISI